MTNRLLKTLLTKLGACSEAKDWIGSRDLATAWKECERIDWMLWLCGRMEGKKGWPTRQQIVLVACDCAELTLPYVTKGDDRSRIAIETARRWTNGNATIDEVIRARNGAYAAAYDAAAYATAVGYAAAYAAAAATAAADAADAADAAAYAGTAANAATKVRQQCLDIVRILSIPMGDK